MDRDRDRFGVHAAAELCVENLARFCRLAVYKQQIAAAVIPIADAVTRTKRQIQKAGRAGDVDGIFLLRRLEAALVRAIGQCDRVSAAGDVHGSKRQRALDGHHIVR